MCTVTHRIPSFSSNGHLAHSLGGVGEVADVQTSRGIMVVSELDGGGVEVEISGWYCLLPSLKGRHGMIAEFVGESSDGV